MSNQDKWTKVIADSSKPPSPSAPANKTKFSIPCLRTLEELKSIRPELNITIHHPCSPKSDKTSVIRRKATPKRKDRFNSIKELSRKEDNNKEPFVKEHNRREHVTREHNTREINRGGNIRNRLRLLPPSRKDDNAKPGTLESRQAIGRASMKSEKESKLDWEEEKRARLSRLADCPIEGIVNEKCLISTAEMAQLMRLDFIPRNPLELCHKFSIVIPRGELDISDSSDSSDQE